MDTFNQDSLIITPRQLAVLQEIESFQVRQCYSPTMEELAHSLGVSRPTIFEHIAELREKGLVEPSCGKARSLLLTEPGRRLLKDAAGGNAADGENAFIPLLGRVSAGYGIDAAIDTQSLGLAELFGRTGDLFALHVQGDSMINAGIVNGDYIICKYSPTAENGQIVIALLNQQKATVKRFFRDKKSVRLAPENDAFEPILSSDCQIQAIVLGLIRRL